MRTLSSLVWMAVAALVLGVASTSASGGFVVEASCSPHELRPYENALVTCEAIIANTGDERGEEARIRILPPTGVLLATIYHVDQRLDGMLLPNQPNGVDVGIGQIDPGQSRTFTIRFIVSDDPVGEYGIDFQLSLEDPPGAHQTARWFVSETAADPPRNLDVELTPREAPPYFPPPLDFFVAPLPSANYDLRISNRSQEPIDSLTATMRFQTGGALVIFPAPASLDNEGLGVVTWDLASFGRTSLAPGEVLTASVNFSRRPGECSYVVPLAIAETAAGASVAPPRLGVPIGTCTYPDDAGHICFSLVGTAPPYPVPCDQSTEPCYPYGSTEFAVPDNGVVCTTAIAPTSAVPTSTPPEATATAPIAGLPETGTFGPSTSCPWALIAWLGVAALSMAAIGLPLRRRRL